MNRFCCTFVQVVYWARDETIDFWGQEVKDQGHTVPKLVSETWRRHHSRPFRSSRLSSWDFIWRRKQTFMPNSRTEK